MTVINTNISALTTQGALLANSQTLATSMQQLSTGKRINSAKDDGVGMAIATRMTQQIQALDLSARNAGDAISLIQTAEGATNEITSMLQRMHELSIQAVNDSITSEQRGYLNLEFQQLNQQILQIAKTTEWNGTPILDGTVGTPVGPSVLDASEPRVGRLTFQIGASAGQVLTFDLADFGSNGSITGAITKDADSANPTVNISTAASALEALGNLDTVMENVNGARANMGAMMNRLVHVINNLSNVVTNSKQTRSQIEDADYAQVSTDLARAQIIDQAATAVLAQANSSAQNVLKLLQG